MSLSRGDQAEAHCLEGKLKAGQAAQYEFGSVQALESFRFYLNLGFPNRRRSDSSFMLDAEASMNAASLLFGSARACG